MSGLLRITDGTRAERDPDAGRDADDYGPGAGGKKRKVPAYPQIAGKDEEDEGLVTEPIPFTPNYRLARSSAAKACSFRKALFLRRKAALITLFLDAQSVIIAETARAGSNRPALPEIPVFEKLLPALEHIGVSSWAPDQPGWRNTLGNERSQRRTRKRVRQKPIVRGGWAPEGSFEFEMGSKTSVAARVRAQDEAALQRLVVELRAIVLSAPKPCPPPVTTPSDMSPPSKTKRRVEKVALIEPTPQMPGKTKKKKRSVLANQSNPHHVNNYRPSRTASPQGGAYEPYPHHASLLFPPPMRLLSARPQRKTAPLPGVTSSTQPIRPAEDDYVCCFCEMALFFGTEKARKRAIRSIRAELRRKEVIKKKAKNVAEGKGSFRDDDDDDDDEYDDCGEDDGYGRCSCGRALSAPHGPARERLKPPDNPDGKDV